MTKTFCDKCGHETKGSEYITVHGANCNSQGTSVDLCASCSEELKRWLNPKYIEEKNR